MAIGATDLTLRDFGLDHCPGMVPEHGPDVISLLTSDMIELQAHHIGLGAIYTRVARQISDNPLLLLAEYDRVTSLSFIEVALSMTAVV